jgi:long-chain fatty acid transport protein
MNLFIRLLFLCLVGMAGTAQAFLVSVKSAGMGVTGAAYAQDAESGGYNPANIVDEGTRVDLGLSFVHSHGRVTISGNAIPPLNGTFNPYDLKNFYNPHLGIVKQFCGNWAASIVCYNKTHAYTQYPNTFPLLGTSNLRVNLIQEIIAPMVAYKFNDYFSVGLGLNIVIQKFDAYGLQNMEPFSVNPTAVTNRGNDFSYGTNVCLGVKFNPFSWLSLGASWQPKITMTRFKRYAGFLAQGGRMDHPETINAGIMIQPIESVHLLFDVQHIRYSKIPSLHNPLYKTFPFIAADPLFALGGEKGPGFGWHDQTVFKFGIDFGFNEHLTLRAGYRFGATPFGKSQTTFNIADDEVVQSYVTGGASWKWNESYEVSFYCAFGLHNHKAGEDSIPPAFGGGEVGLSQSIQAYGLSIGKIF